MKLSWLLKKLQKFWIQFNKYDSNTRLDFYKPKLSTILFFGLFVALFFVYNFDTISFLRPQSVHQWRQCDCLSFSLNYFQENISFWQPQINYLGSDGTGKTVSDFPIIYYIVAQLWKLFGQHEYIYRFLILIISFLGTLALLKTTESILKSSFWALIISLLLFSSTIFVYYSNNFLMNVPAFSFALIALYYFYQYTIKQKQILLIISILLFLIGGLLKIQALSGFVAIGAIYLLEIGKIIKFKNNIFAHKKLSFVLFSILIIITFSWYYYAHQYNNEHNKGIFLIGILPIWDYSAEQIKHVFNYAYILWSNSYQSQLLQITAIFIFLFITYHHKKLNKHLKIFLFLLFIGFISYITLWFQVFDNHDYYMINQLLFMLVIFISALVLIKTNFPRIYYSKLFKIGILLLLIYNINTCRKNINVRYNGWPNNKHVKYTKAFEDIESFLPTINIQPNDKVIVLHDPSFNISLYLMNRKGYTNCLNQLQDSAEIAQKIEKNANYLFINDSSLLSKKYLQPFIKQKIGQYKNVSIFKLN